MSTAAKSADTVLVAGKRECSVNPTVGMVTATSAPRAPALFIIRRRLIRESSMSYLPYQKLHDILLDVIHGNVLLHRDWNLLNENVQLTIQ